MWNLHRVTISIQFDANADSIKQIDRIAIKDVSSSVISNKHKSSFESGYATTSATAHESINLASELSTDSYFDR